VCIIMTDIFLKPKRDGMGSVDNYRLVNPYPSSWLNVVTDQDGPRHIGMESRQIIDGGGTTSTLKK